MPTSADLDTALTALEGQVTTTNGVEDSAVAAINGLVQKLKDAQAGGGPAQAQLDRINAVLAAIPAHTQPLADAIAANP